MSTNVQFALAHRAQVEEFRRKHRTGLVTLLFTDLVGSTQLKAALGDHAGVALIQSHHAAVRELLAQFADAQEISTAGDSFFIVFVKPSDAVRFALRVQHRLRALATDSPHPLRDRIGIHIGEVVIEEREGVPKPRDLYGIQVDIAARVMGLANGDQILLTRAAFDNARQVLKGEDVEPSDGLKGLNRLQELNWLNHGPYLLQGLDESVEICEVGEGGVAHLKPPADGTKAKRQVSADAEPVLGWRPALEQAVPGTQWVLEQKLGEGGFGEVWLGRHRTMKERRVFKFCFRADRVRSLKREMTLFRVLKERVGDHPNIVRLLEVYFDEPPYYVVMDHVEGQDLKGWCEQQGGVEKVPLAARLEIVAQIADALQAAHDAGVIHRDVKPGNILVSNPKSEIRDPKLEVKLTDFGIGQVVSEEVLKGITRTGFTQTLLADSSSSQTGSQMYMAPELLAGKPASIRSDIYSLGVVLYQLLVGDLPRPVTVDWGQEISEPLLRDDLAHCFAGDPKDRFAGAGQLAKNLRSLPDRRAAYQERRRTELAAQRRRRTTLVSAGVAVVLSLVAIALGYGLRRAESEASKVRRNLYAADMKLAHQAWEGGNLHRAQTLLRDHLPQAGQPDLRGFEWRYLSKLCRDESLYSFTNFTNEVRSAAFSPEYRLLAVGSGKVVTLLDVAGRRVVDVLPDDGGWITALAFSPTAPNVLATAVSPDEAMSRSNLSRAFKSSWTPKVYGGNSVIKLWNFATKKVIAIFPGHTAEIQSIAFSSDGKRLASASWDGTVRLWDVASQRATHTNAHHYPVLDVAFTRDGKMLACLGGRPHLELCDAATGEGIEEYDSVHTALPLAMAFSQGDERLATVSNDGVVVLWDFNARPKRSKLTGHQGPIESVAFALDGKLLATGGTDNTIRIWDVTTEREVAILRGHRGPVEWVAFTRDGQTLVSGGLDGSVKVWTVAPRSDVDILKGHPGWVEAVVFSPDSKTIASVDFGAFLVKLWDVSSQRFLTNLVGHTDVARCAVFSPSGRTLATGSHDRTVKLWDLATRTEISSLTNEFQVCSVAFSPDGNTLAAAGDGVTFWDVVSRQPIKGLIGDTRGVYFVAFSPTGGLVAAGYLDGRVGLWDFASRQLLASFKKHESQVKSLAFSNDGTLLASGSHDATVVLYDIAGRRVLETLRGHTFIVHGVAFSPDNKTLASASWDGTVKLWNLASRQLALTLRGHPGPVAGVAFARDGSLMATCGADSEVNVRLWPAASLAEINAGKASETH